MPPENCAVERFYRENRQRLFTVALAVTRRADRAEDAVQEVFCRLLRSAAPPENMAAYVFRAVRNAAVDSLRRDRPSTEMSDHFIFDPRPDPSASAAAADFQRRAAEALQTLPPDECETIVSHLYGGLTFQECADVREVPLGTVTAWYRRGLEKLRTRLEP